LVGGAGASDARSPVSVARGERGGFKLSGKKLVVPAADRAKRILIPAVADGAVVLVLVAGFAVFLWLPATRRLGVDLRFWMASYALYLVAVFFPQSSTFRLLVPLAPGLGVLAIPENRVYRAGLVVAGIAGQIAWLYVAWWVDGQDFTPP
jgi:hypothetical protein